MSANGSAESLDKKREERQKKAERATDGKIQRSFLKLFSLQPTKSSPQSRPHFDFFQRDIKLRWECFLGQIKAKLLLQRHFSLVKLFIRQTLSEMASNVLSWPMLG